MLNLNREFVKHVGECYLNNFGVRIERTKNYYIVQLYKLTRHVPHSYALFNTLTEAESFIEQFEEQGNIEQRELKANELKNLIEWLKSDCYI